MSHDRDALITAYRMMTGCTDIEADRVVRNVETVHAEKQNADLLAALDEGDAPHVRVLAAYQDQIRVMSEVMERFPDKHMRFGNISPDGTVEEPDKCADWCYACQLDRLRAEVNSWKAYERQARGACIRIARIHEHPGVVLMRLQAGQYEEAVNIIKTRAGTDPTPT